MKLVPLVGFANPHWVDFIVHTKSTASAELGYKGITKMVQAPGYAPGSTALQAVTLTTIV